MERIQVPKKALRAQLNPAVGKFSSRACEALVDGGVRSGRSTGGDERAFRSSSGRNPANVLTFLAMNQLAACNLAQPDAGGRAKSARSLPEFSKVPKRRKVRLFPFDCCWISHSNPPIRLTVTNSSGLTGSDTVIISLKANNGAGRCFVAHLWIKRCASQPTSGIPDVGPQERRPETADANRTGRALFDGPGKPFFAVGLRPDGFAEASRHLFCGP